MGTGGGGEGQDKASIGLAKLIAWVRSMRTESQVRFALQPVAGQVDNKKSNNMKMNNNIINDNNWSSNNKSF